MFVQNLLKSGWIHALFIGLLTYPLGTLSQKFVANNPDINILTYTCLCMLSTSWILLVIAGPGKLTTQALKQVHTWVYGVLEMFTISIGIVIMIYISATEAAALARTTAIFTFLLSSILLQQRSSFFEKFGFCILILGFFTSIYMIEADIKIKVLLTFLVAFKNFLQAAKKTTIELHKINRKTRNFKEELRVTGSVMAISSLIITIGLISVAICQSFYGVTIHEALPDLNDFANKKMYVMAIVAGIVIISVSRYLEFYVSKTLGSRYLMAMASLQIVGIYGLERILSHTGYFEMTSFSKGQYLALGIILLGNVVIALAGFIKDMRFIKTGTIQDTLKNMEENFVDSKRDFNLVKLNLTSLLALYDEDSKKLSEDINIDRIKLDNIMSYDLEDVKLKRGIAKKINEFASHNVALKDKLTKAYNRYYLANKVNELLDKEIDFKLYLLDLNKFKYVNDTFGHKAGDMTLVETVKRLNSLMDKESVFRVGGDEFVLIQYKDLDIDLYDKILEAIEEPISYKEHILESSTSIGFTLSSQHHDLNEMLAFADKAMYKNKKDTR
ncbi:MAG: GGDEF domain-containing protein [Proteobacteria bacterium]|nr:GGDEF domain-containing protein [Pseudomonadota bacterium]